MAFRYSNVEYTEMVRSLAICGDNVSAAVRYYEEHFGIRVSWQTMQSATQRLRDYGQFYPPTAVDRGVARIPTTVQEGILDYMSNNPESSTSRAGTLFNVSQSYAWKTIRDAGQQSYHFGRAQELSDSDRAQRIAFSKWWLRNRGTNILWTDECTFTSGGLNNNNSLARADSFEDRYSVIVWAGIIDTQVIGPVYLPRLNSETYLHFLSTTLPNLLDDLPLQYSRGGGFYYQHDGVPAHFSKQACDYLNQEYGDRWIGRSGPVQWPARSPDLNKLNFYLWGHVKDIVYQTELQSENELKNKIESAFNTLKQNTHELSKLDRNMRKRARLCIKERGGHFEQLLRLGLEDRESKYKNLADHTMVTDTEVFPYVAAILRRSTYISAGALIDENWVLTAADSLFLTRETLKTLRVRLGSINYKKGGILLPIKMFHIHPNFDDQRPVFDVALLMLPETVRFTPTLRPIRLLKTPKMVSATHYLVTSWYSALNQNQSTSQLESMESIIRRRMLSVSHLHPSDPEDCADELKALDVNKTDVVMCLEPAGWADSCGRDTGAPVVLNGVLWGIVSSWKPLNCHHESAEPSFVTLVSAADVLSWIHATIHRHQWIYKDNEHTRN